MCCDQPCGKPLSCGKHVETPTRCSLDLLASLPLQRNALRNVQKALSGTSWLSPPLLARVLPRGALRPLPPAGETPLLLRQGDQNVRVLGGQRKERRGLFLVRESVWEAAGGLQTRLPRGVPRGALRAVRAGDRREVSLRVENGAHSVLEGAADGGLQRGQRSADSAVLLAGVRREVVGQRRREKRAVCEVCAVETRPKHSPIFRCFCCFFVSALALDRCGERVCRAARASAACFPPPLGCLCNKHTHNININAIIFARWKHTTSTYAYRPNRFRGSSGRSSCRSGTRRRHGRFARAVCRVRTTSSHSRRSST